MMNFFKKYFEYLKTERKYKALLGPKIGSGVSRTTYVMKHDPTRVVKVATSEWSLDNSNILEYEIWQAIEGSKYDKNFAKCYEISPCGKYLIQDRVDGVGTVKYDKKKTKLPEFIGDVHSYNFGVRDGEPVLVDYAVLKVKGSNRDYSC